MFFIPDTTLQKRHGAEAGTKSKFRINKKPTLIKWLSFGFNPYVYNPKESYPTVSRLIITTLNIPKVRLVSETLDCNLKFSIFLIKVRTV